MAVPLGLQGPAHSTHPRPLLSHPSISLCYPSWAASEEEASELPGQSPVGIGKILGGGEKQGTQINSATAEQRGGSRQRQPRSHHMTQQCHPLPREEPREQQEHRPTQSFLVDLTASSTAAERPRAQRPTDGRTQGQNAAQPHKGPGSGQNRNGTRHGPHSASPGQPQNATPCAVLRV